MTWGRCHICQVDHLDGGLIGKGLRLEREKELRGNQAFPGDDAKVEL